MRLINVKTLELESFDRYNTPYAILSHRWGPEEVTYEDMRAGPSDTARRKQGFAKIQGACDTASGLGYDYVWVDTCCIDKSSSAELSEAINSMFDWYRQTWVCFAFLDDVTADGQMPLSKSLWFTRGWTLQELIAPSEVVFYDRTWKKIGDRRRMSRELAEVTRIPAALLARLPVDPVTDWLETYSIAAKMSWASRRETTRIEDQAYCLMGLFGVHLPLLYGERHKSFRRLQEAIVRETPDMSILLHNGRETLAYRASSFMGCGDVEPGPPIEEEFGVVITSSGLELTALTCPAKVVYYNPPYEDRPAHQEVRILALLNCNYAGDHLSRPALLYRHAGDDGNADKAIRDADFPFIRINSGDETGERVYNFAENKVRSSLRPVKMQNPATIHQT
ncbi:HET-domain-containing protein [Coniochaeta ligniaria NRRL 30616]|uniref:HET-domain-containing protein n=1 Tax=Coniochaeta ligniaria NRRL 30616 TaxID=1408157 RepID=A0A1J7INP8_9PEZI|nr:HET-domain-containing protein [Coniochaeta ligniaria NRRL 30616]